MIPILNAQTVIEHLANCNTPYFAKCYAFYSSWFKGIVTDPRLMMVPIDDHMVHRGDGIFEAMKSVNGKIYLLDEHLQRLVTSASLISLQLPMTLCELKTIIMATLRAANKLDTTIRIFVSRGPGGFSVNPFDCVSSQLYVVVHDLTPPSPDKYEKGVRIGKSSIPTKNSWMAQVKSCNYLPNVLMKKEAVERNLDYVIGIDDTECLTESATENLLIIDQKGAIVHPPLTGILRGTTMIRICELAKSKGFTILERPFFVSDLLSAQEAMITGTSLNVLPVVSYEGQNIGNGKVGTIAKKLNQLMLDDIESLSKT